MQVNNRKSISSACRQILLVLAVAAYSHTTLAAGAGGIRPSVNTEAVIYVVQKGDNLIKLTRNILNSGTDWPEIARINNINPKHRIYPEQKLLIPMSLLKIEIIPAKIASASGQVTYTEPGSAEAKNARDGQSIAEGSILRTGLDSTAVLALGDGTAVKILPSSVVELKRHSAYQDKFSNQRSTWFSGVLRLLQGEIENRVPKGVQRSEPLKIETPTSFVGVRGTVFRTTYVPDLLGTTRIELQEGQVQTGSSRENIAPIEMDAGYGVVVDRNTTVIKAEKLLPPPVFLVNTNPSLGAYGNIAWQPVQGAQSYQVEIAKDTEFNQTERYYATEVPQYRVGGLSAGDWYMRVRAIAPSQLQGMNAVHRFSVNQTIVPTTAWSLLRNDFISNGNWGVLRLTTLGVNEKLGLLVQIYKDKDMKELLAEEGFRDSSRINMRVDNLPASNTVTRQLYMRLTPLTPNGQFGGSAAYLLQLPERSDIATNIAFPLPTYNTGIR